jgi:hypothetical protein
MNLLKYAATNLRGLLLLSALLLGTVTAGAVERILRIDAPATVKPGRALTVTVFAATDAGQGEQIGFLQVESSVDGGRTWVAVCYLDKVGATVERPVNLTAGAVGSRVQVRARAAFRDGLAGDVDYTGAALRWNDSWAKWAEPPAKSVVIAVVAH